jgi:RHS repeat-associated protein
VPLVLAQLTSPELDNAEHDVPGRLSADFAYGYGLTFASDERGGTAVHRDAYGSAVRTPDTQAWVEASHYDVFGAPRDGQRQPGSDDPRLPRFGYRSELALGPVLDLRARVYDADLGRFTTRDPLLSGPPKPGQPANPYLYANNDPVNFTDPLGTLAVAPLSGGQFRNVVPAAPAPRRPSATAVLTSALVLGARGGDNTTLHTAATFAATDYLIDQIAAVRGLEPLDIGIEEKLPGSPKDLLWHSQPPDWNRYGKADIFLEYEIVLPRTVYIWEVKSAIDHGPIWATARAIAEGQWYVNNFNMTQNVGANGRVAELGQGMFTPLYVSLFPTAPQYPDIIVLSPPNTDGAVIYDHDNNNRNDFPDVPVYAYIRKGKKGKASRDLYQVSGPVPAQAVQRQFELAAFSGLGVHLTTSPADLEAAAVIGGLGAILLRIAAEFLELGGAG